MSTVNGGYYGGIVNDKLDVFLNLTNKNSYSGIGDTIYDLTNQYNSTMFNFPTYNNDEYRY